MYTNNLFTGTKLLDRVQKVSAIKYGTKYKDIGLVTLHLTAQKEPFFIVNNNAMEKIGTVSRKEIKAALKHGNID